MRCKDVLSRGRCPVVLLLMAMLVPAAETTRADVYHLKLVTDGNPDYSDLGSLIHSATGNVAVHSVGGGQGDGRW